MLWGVESCSVTAHIQPFGYVYKSKIVINSSTFFCFCFFVNRWQTPSKRKKIAVCVYLIIAHDSYEQFPFRTAVIMCYYQFITMCILLTIFFVVCLIYIVHGGTVLVLHVYIAFHTSFPHPTL